MKLRIAPLQTQKPILAPSLQQSIAVLLLPVMELNITVEQELQNNPLLELDETHPEYLEQRENELKTDIDKINKLSSLPKHEHSHDDDLPDESPLTKKISLEEHLLQQLRLEISDPLDFRIGELLIGNINEDGYLTVTPEEIALLLEIQDNDRIERVLAIVQNLEPAGIAARSLKECLLIQIKPTQLSESSLSVRIIKDHLDDLGRRKYAEIGRKVGASLEDVKEAARFIASLEPKPARNYRPIASNIYIKPDVFIKQDDEGNYHIVVNKAENPPLRINHFYRTQLNNDKLNAEEKAFIREKLTNAINFIKSISQRGQTIQRITKFILDHQRDFFDNDSPVVPMKLKDVAEAISRNESTISRAISNKYIDTPKGLLPMKYFFSQAVPSRNEGEEKISVQSIKEEMQDLVDHENKSYPLSDQEIQGYFRKKGMTLARRTISKYRQALNIPPSYLRKN